MSVTDWPVVSNAIAKAVGAGDMLFTEMEAKKFVIKLYRMGVTCTQLETLARGTCCSVTIRNMLIDQTPSTGGMNMKEFPLPVDLHSNMTPQQTFDTIDQYMHNVHEFFLGLAQTVSRLNNQHVVVSPTVDSALHEVHQMIEHELEAKTGWGRNELKQMIAQCFSNYEVKLRNAEVVISKSHPATDEEDVPW